MSDRTATVTDIVGPTSYDTDTIIVHATTDHDHTATLYYPDGEQPTVGKHIRVWFEMGGWSTDDSRIYQNSQYYEA